jgi:hypothetical protein
MNVFIAIIEEAYITIKMKNKNHWIYMYLKLDNQYVELKEGKKRSQQFDKIEEKSVEESERHGTFSDVPADTITVNVNEKSENTLKGLDYFFYKIDEEIIQIKKIIDDTNKIQDKEIHDNIKRHYNIRMKELEGKLKNLKEK